MRSRIMVIGRDVGSRARLARLLSREGYRAEVAESLAHARRAGLDTVALAIVANELDGSEAEAVEELRAAVGRVLVVAPGAEARSLSGRRRRVGRARPARADRGSADA